jgi:hypothetical protein
MTSVSMKFAIFRGLTPSSVVKITYNLKNILLRIYG